MANIRAGSLDVQKLKLGRVEFVRGTADQTCSRKSVRLGSILEVCVQRTDSAWVLASHEMIKLGKGVKLCGWG